MDGDDRAAEAAEAVQTTLARLQVDVGRYSALRLAAAVLQRGIERYREKNQGPVLARAGRLFADLTGGSFVRPPDRRRRRAAPCSRGSGPTAASSASRRMSNGSHDQLYLALRLASLESWLRVARADPVRRRRHPPELRRPPRPGRAAGPRRALAADPGPLLHPPPPPGRPRRGEPPARRPLRPRAPR